MPALVCDLDPLASTRLHEYWFLAATGESLALILPPGTTLAAGGGWVKSAAELALAWEDETIAVLADIPDWLPGDEFHRVVVVTESRDDTLAQALLARGCEAVEIVAPEAMQDLAQSWNSGRRLPGRRLTQA